MPDTKRLKACNIDHGLHIVHRYRNTTVMDYLSGTRHRTAESFGNLLDMNNLHMIYGVVPSSLEGNGIVNGISFRRVTERKLSNTTAISKGSSIKE